MFTDEDRVTIRSLCSLENWRKEAGLYKEEVYCGKTLCRCNYISFC